MLDKNIYSNIKNLLLEAKSQIVQSVNSTMVYTYFEIWKIIVESEQWGNERALYWKETLKNLSTDKRILKRFLNKKFRKNEAILYYLLKKSDTVWPI